MTLKLTFLNWICHFCSWIWQFKTSLCNQRPNCGARFGSTRSFNETSIYDIIVVAGGTFSGACYCENGQGRKGDHPCPTNGDHYCDICDPGFTRITNAGSTLRSKFLVRLAQFRKLPGFSSEIVGRDFFFKSRRWTIFLNALYFLCFHWMRLWE